MTQFILPGLYTAQALSQAGVTHFQSGDHATFETIHKIQHLFDALNIGAILIGGWELCVAIEREWGVFTWLADASVRVPEVWSIPLFVAAGFVLAVYGVVSLANQYFKPTIDVDAILQDMGDRDNIHAEYDNSTYQVWMQCYAAIQLVVSVAMVFFSTMPVFYVATALLQFYTFMRTTGWQFIRIDRTFPETAANLATRMLAGGEGFIQSKFSYYLSVFPFTSSGQEKPECAICFDDEAQLSHFCSSHGFCTPCMIKTIATAAQHFDRGSEYTRTRVISRNQYGHVTDDYIKYDGKLLKSSLPNCSLCRGTPSQNEVEEHIEDQHNGTVKWVKVNLEIVEPAPIVNAPPGAVLDHDEVDGGEEGEAEGDSEVEMAHPAGSAPDPEYVGPEEEGDAYEPGESPDSGLGLRPLPLQATLTPRSAAEVPRLMGADGQEGDELDSPSAAAQPPGGPEVS